MNVGVFPLLGALVIGGPPAAEPPPSSPPPVMAQPGHTRGILPVPSMGPPGAVAAVGAYPAVAPPTVSMPMPAPLVGAKFLTPQGVRITVFPGTRLARMFDAPVVMGLRPGYVYRFELSNLPFNPGKTLYPEVEVRGVLVPRPGMKYLDFPLPFVFSQADIGAALSGGLITRVVYLEDPNRAVPADVQPDRPIELPDATEAEAIKNATANGRLMVIIRLGDRKPSPELLQTAAIPGTVLFPGDNYLKAPALPPVFPFFSVPLYDPILGARLPKEECFPNGGDRGDILGIAPDGRLGGLNPTDVGVEYTIGNKRRVTTSNVAKICSPRFMMRRVELFPGGLDIRQILGLNIERQGPGYIRERAAPMLDVGREKSNEFVGRLRPAVYVGKVGISFFLGSEKPMAIGQVVGVKVVGVVVEPEMLTVVPGAPLTVTKSIDPPGPKQSGDVVTITLRYANTGLAPIADLVVSDSLSGRLEYIPGTAQTDRAANFAAVENEAGSLILRWELPGELLPGQAGTIKFKARVR
jgi:uncharacterized repeat protein (TIGR01451 family)